MVGFGRASIRCGKMVPLKGDQGELPKHDAQFSIRVLETEEHRKPEEALLPGFAPPFAEESVLVPVMSPLKQGPLSNGNGTHFLANAERIESSREEGSWSSEGNAAVGTLGGLISGREPMILEAFPEEELNLPGQEQGFESAGKRSPREDRGREEAVGEMESDAVQDERKMNSSEEWASRDYAEEAERRFIAAEVQSRVYAEGGEWRRHAEEGERRINGEEEERKLHLEDGEARVDVEKAERRVHAEEEARVHAEEWERRVNADEGEGKVHAEGEVRVHAEEWESRVNVDEGEGKVHAEGEVRVHAEEWERRVNVDEGEEKVHAEREARVHAEEWERRVNVDKGEGKVQAEREARVHAEEWERRVNVDEGEGKVDVEEGENRVQAEEEERGFYADQAETRVYAEEGEIRIDANGFKAGQTRKPLAEMRKVKKKASDVWGKTSSRRSSKKKKASKRSAELEDCVTLYLIDRNQGRLEDGPDAPILLSRINKSARVELNEDRLVAGSTKGYKMVMATRGVVEGAWYFEIIVEKLGPTGHTRLGWSTSKGEIEGPLGYDCHSYAYRDVDGSKVHTSFREPYGEAYFEGDVIGFYINLPNGRKLGPKSSPIVCYRGQPWFLGAAKEPLSVVPGSEILLFRNGICQGVAFKDIYGGRYYPAASMYTLPNQPNCSVRFNFGPNFKFPPIDVGDRPLPMPMFNAPFCWLDGSEAEPQ